jgi:hypothetical protein
MSSAADPHELPKIVALDSQRTQQILAWKSYSTESVGQIFKVAGFDNYNHLVDINRVFSSMPTGMPVDRTQQAVLPVKFHQYRTWTVPTQSWSLAEALAHRVTALEAMGQHINLFWSGGIDSTAMVVAFLKHSTARQQLRIFYSPFSTYEHPGYLEFLSQYTDIELIDISGTVYLTHQYDGIFVTGDGGDELNASLDESFIEKWGVAGLRKPWLDLFVETNRSDQFLEFCGQYFSAAGRPIETVLEARWFFYTVCKNRFQLTRKLDLFLNRESFDPGALVGFFDCAEYENFIYWNLDQVITGSDYSSWKQPLKQYCCDFDGFVEWCNTKQKINSTQIIRYSDKYKLVNDKRYIFLLSDFERVATPSLPFFSQQEFDNCYSNRLDHLFNEPI